MFLSKSAFQKIIEQFLFTRIEVLLLLLSGLLLVLASFFQQARQSSDEVVALEDYFQNEILSSAYTVFDWFIDTVATANVATMFLWAVVGAALYIGFWAGYSALYGANNTLKSAFKYVHPKGFHIRDFLLNAVAERVVFIALLFAVVLYGSVLINTVIPYLFDEVTERLKTVDPEMAWVVLYLVALLVTVHLWVALVRLLRGRHRHEELDELHL